mmetsp:Transcript_31000/g.52465  ORF Transcript_31000/g.52465 Transcript_31000/m.52465 type:complete len:232 (-) Transcript_31000:45-740(-)
MSVRSYTVGLVLAPTRPLFPPLMHSLRNLRLGVLHHFQRLNQRKHNILERRPISLEQRFPIRLQLVAEQRQLVRDRLHLLKLSLVFGGEQRPVKPQVPVGSLREFLDLLHGVLRHTNVLAEGFAAEDLQGSAAALGVPGAAFSLVVGPAVTGSLHLEPRLVLPGPLGQSLAASVGSQGEQHVAIDGADRHPRLIAADAALPHHACGLGHAVLIPVVSPPHIHQCGVRPAWQ